MKTKALIAILLISMLMVQDAESWFVRIRAIENTHVTPLPYYMDYYDIDDNDLLSLEEIAVTLGDHDVESDLVKAFNMTDIDQDGMLTEEEFFSSKCLIFRLPDPVPMPTEEVAQS